MASRQSTRSRGRASANALAGRVVPYNGELELAVLGGLMLEASARIEELELAPTVFYEPAHRRLFEALTRCECSAPPPELVRSYLEGPDFPLVAAAIAGALFGAGLESGIERLKQLGEKRLRAGELVRELELLAPAAPVADEAGEGERGEPGGVPIERANGKGKPGGRPASGDYFAGGQYVSLAGSSGAAGLVNATTGEMVLPWAPHVEGAYLNGEAHYRVRVGADTDVVAASELRDHSAWDRFPEATGRSGRSRGEMLADLVIAMGAPLMERATVPAWEAGELRAPSPEAVEALELEALRGYGRMAAAAGPAGWQELCGELASVPRLALYVGAALGGVFLPVAGLDWQLAPLGFVVHAIGEGGTGKTTAQVVSAAVLGDPRPAPAGLVRSWSASRLGLPALTAGAGELPLVLSDTSTWSGTPAELAATVMRILEGPRSISTRTGEMAERGTAYRSIVLSSGNSSISAGAVGTPILRRVVEVEAPMTIDAAHALRLKTIAAEAFGWPLRQVLEGRLEAKVFQKAQRLGAAGLVDPADPPIVADVALRCSVLIAGTFALAMACEAPNAEELVNAACDGAGEVLDNLRAALEESHRPAGEELLAAVWHYYQGRAWAFPSLIASPLERAQTEGWLTEAGNLALLPATLRQVCAGVGLVDPLPALRDLRDRGALVCHGERRLTGRVIVRGEPVRGVYIFKPEPETRVFGAPEGGAPGSEGPKDARETRARRADNGPISSKDARDARPGTALVNRGGEDVARALVGGAPSHAAWAKAEQLGLLQDGLWTSEPASWSEDAVRELEACLEAKVEVPAPGGEARQSPPPPFDTGRGGPGAGADRQVVLALDGERFSKWGGGGLDGPQELGTVWDLGELAELALTHNAGSLWLTPSALERLEWPAELPRLTFGQGLPHAAVTLMLDGGAWTMDRPREVKGLAPLMLLRRGRATLEVRVPAWRDEHEVQWPHFGTLRGAIELAGEVHALQQALWPGRGWRLNYGPISTFRALAASLEHRHELEVPSLEWPEELVCPELPNWLGEVPGEGFVVAYDRNRAFLAALGTVTLSLDQPSNHVSLTAAKPAALERLARRPGYWQADPVAGGRWGELLRPSGAQGPLWLPSAIVGLGLEERAACGALRPSLAILGTSSLRYFRPMADRLHEGLESLADRPAAMAELKRIYSKGVTVLSERAYCGEGQRQWWRPDWKAEILGEHAANTVRALLRATEAGARVVGTGLRDTALFALEEPGADPPGLKVGTGTGQWKRKGRPMLASSVAAMAAAGAGVAEVVREMSSGG